MLFKNMLMALCLIPATLAAYRCKTNIDTFSITQDRAKDAMEAGGTEKGKSGFPHKFGGSSGGGAQLKFYGADPKCNEKNPDLLEFPVLKTGGTYDKTKPHGHTGTPARVVYLKNGKTLCGVMTHVIENKDTHAGSGNFRVCDD